MEQAEVIEMVCRHDQSIINLEGWQKTQNGALLRLDKKVDKLGDKFDTLIEKMDDKFDGKVQSITKKSEGRLYNLLEKGGFLLLGFILSKLF